MTLLEIQKPQIMRNTLLTIALFTACAVFVVQAQNQEEARMARLYRGVGPVEKISESVSDLPENAQTFINTIFPSTSVAFVTRNLVNKEYEVRMSDGTEITFTDNVIWKEIEAPDNAMLPSSSLSGLLKEDAVIETIQGDEIANGGVQQYIEEIVYIPGYGYWVEYEISPVAHGKVFVTTSGDVVTTGQTKNL